MKKESLYDDLSESKDIFIKYFGLSFNKFIFLVALVLGLGIYLGILLYGKNSLQVLFELSDYENYLQVEIKRLKDENSKLQKEYFELEEISAQ